MTDQSKAITPYENYQKIKAYGSSPEVMNTFVQLIGRTAPHFIQSALTAVQSNDRLMECSPRSVFRAALRAATLGLTCDPSLGHAFIVPYKNKKGEVEANFQPGWRGIQYMALRTGKYVYINVAPIYEGEEVIEDRITGDLKIEGNATGSSKTIGLVASFKLITGYKKAIYMTNEEMDEHGKKYSKSYTYSDSVWNTNRKMAYHKTIILKLLRTYGYISPNEAAMLGDDDEAVIVDADLPSEDAITIIEHEPVSMEEGNKLLGFDDDDISDGEFEEEKPIAEPTVGELTNEWNDLVKATKAGNLTPVELAEKEARKAEIKRLITAKREGAK